MSPYVRALRAAVGTARLLIPSVTAIVRQPIDRILLVQSRDDYCWSTPGGAIELNETPADAVVREVWEETGLVVTPRRVVAVYGGPTFVVRYPNGDETQYISAIFDCDVESGGLRADGDEVEAARFCTYAEALKLPIAGWLTNILPRLFEQEASAWFQPACWRPSEPR